MAAPEPLGNQLWQALTAYVDWPAGDEDRIATVGRGWTDAGTSFLYAGANTNVPAGAAWTDLAGEDYDAATLRLQETVLESGQAMERLGRLATAYGEDVRYAKATITQFVAAWEPYFLQDPATIEPAAAADVTRFLNDMAARIAARSTGGPDNPDGPRPGLVTPEQAAAAPPPPERPGRRQPDDLGPEPDFPDQYRRPDGPRSEVGRELWGAGLKGAREALNRTPAELRQIISKQKAEDLLEFYAYKARQIPSNETAQVRVELLRKVIEAWG
jgi:hypothetical protein